MLAPLGGLKPMSWLSSPKVRLALIVNGLYFISIFTPTTPHTRPRFFAHARATREARPAPPLQRGSVPPASSYKLSRASASESGGLLHVSLYQDLTLVERPGRTLLLSPSFNARQNPAEEPDFVLLNFIRYSGDETCPDDCPLTITADNATVRTSYSHGSSPGWQRERVPHSAEKLEDGRVVETMGAESLSTWMSYEGFIDMISAERVIIRLGPDRVELNHDQREALRDMYRRLTQPPRPDESDSN